MVKVFFGRAMRAAAFLCALAVAQPAAASGYAPNPGDVLRLAVVGLTDADVSAVVDEGGQANFRQYGVVTVSGLALQDIQAELRRRVEGQVLKRYGADGSPLFIALSPEDVFLEVAAFAPVYVDGDVASPGAVDFRPGLTLRAAVATAGGRRGAALGVSDDVARTAPRLQADYGTLALQQAGLLARLWRVEAAEAGLADPAPPQVQNLPVAADVFASMIDVQRSQLRIDLERLAAQRAFLEASLRQAQARLSILEEQNAQQQVAVKDDEEEQGRVKGLLDRGMVQTTRFLDSRRALLLSSTRLLDVQNNLARVELEVTNFERQIVALDEDRARLLLTERETVRQQLHEVGARLEGARLSLEALGLEAELPGLDADSVEPTFILHRRQDGVMVSRPVDSDILLLPGDVVEVIAGDTAPTLTP